MSADSYEELSNKKLLAPITTTQQWILANSKIQVIDFLGYASLGMSQGTDTGGQWSLNGSSLASLLIGQPGPTLSFGPGGSTLVDTHLSRKSAGAFTINNGAGELISARLTNSNTSASYTLALTDQSRIVDCNNASAQTVTVPPNSSVAFPTGTRLIIRQYGAGQVTVSPGSGVTLNSMNTSLVTPGQYGGLMLHKRATDEWIVSSISNLVVDTDTTLAANSDSKIPSQKAVKTYVDNNKYIDLISLLPATLYIAHRGGSSVMPEETIGAFNMAEAVGSDMIEFDVDLLNDGSLALIHDSTVDRTTDGSGSVSLYDAVSIKSLDATDAWPIGYESDTIPLFNEVLDKFGGKIVLCPEPKSTSALQPMIDMVVARKLQRCVIFQAVSDAQITTIVSSGCVAVRVYTSEPTTGNIATAVSNGASYLCGNGETFSQAKLQEMAAALPTWCFTINRRNVRDTLLGYGITGFMTDQPAYLQQTTALHTTDSWRYNVLGHGLIHSGYTSNIQEIMLTLGLDVIRDGCIRIPSAVGTTYYNCVGEVSPLANAAGTYTIDYDVRLESGTPGSAGMALAIAPDDGDYRMHTTYYPNGWLIYMRESGIYSTFKTTAPSTATSMGGFTLSGATYAAGQWIHMKVEFTATTVKVTATNQTTGGTGTVTVNDSSFRGGYVYVGKTGTANTIAFKNLTIT